MVPLDWLLIGPVLSCGCSVGNPSHVCNGCTNLFWLIPPLWEGSINLHFFLLYHITKVSHILGTIGSNRDINMNKVLFLPSRNLWCYVEDRQMAGRQTHDSIICWTTTKKEGHITYEQVRGHLRGKNSGCGFWREASYLDGSRRWG